jgi:RNase P subunit RPR2
MTNVFIATYLGKRLASINNTKVGQMMRLSEFEVNDRSLQHSGWYWLEVELDRSIHDIWCGRCQDWLYPPTNPGSRHKFEVKSNRIICPDCHITICLIEIGFTYTEQEDMI